MTAPATVQQKWRPPLALMVFVLVASVLVLPLLGVFFFRIYENQLVHQTEAELIAQSAALAAMVQREVRQAGIPLERLGSDVGAQPATIVDGARPVVPSLDLAAQDLRGPRPDAVPGPAPDPAFVAIGAAMAPVLLETQRATLAGFRLLDPNGVVIAGRGEAGLSLAHVDEVAEALRGTPRAALRLRVSSRPPPPLYSLSRGTGLRVFLAMPVIHEGRIAGVVYASRTPSNVFKHLYDERRKFIIAGLAIVLLSLLIGMAFHRTITRPVRALIARTKAIEAGDTSAMRPLSGHGTAEFAELSHSFLSMAESLKRRSDFIATFAAHVSHEMKSPLTSIQGAAELLRDDIGASPPMSADEQRRFLGMIIADTTRLSAIVQRLRELARAEAQPTGGMVTLAALLTDLRAAEPRLTIDISGETGLFLRISTENLRIVLAHLADNAACHGATRLDITARRADRTVILEVQDNGAGISPNNRARVFDSFFTTRRETGGTGMGLAIVRAMLTAHDGSIAVADSRTGTVFRLVLPISAAAGRAS